MQRPAIREYVLNDVPDGVKEFLNSEVLFQDDADVYMFAYSKEIKARTMLNKLTKLKSTRL
jgi:hypothetical protein